MKTWGSGGIAPEFLTLALDGGEWSASRLCRFTTRESSPGTHWIGGSVGPRAGLDAGNQIPAFQPVAFRYTDWATPTV
jgi:hypothetical protein